MISGQWQAHRGHAVGEGAYQGAEAIPYDPDFEG
jgi:hypothetical protein